MADRYWVGGTGTWGTTTTNWSATSGGAGGASAPTVADNVIFNANSNVGTGAFTVTVSGTRPCLSFTASGLDGAMTLSFSSSAVHVSGNLSIPATNFSTVNGSFQINAASTVSTNNVALGAFRINTGAFTVTLGSALRATEVNLGTGTFNPGANAITTSRFNANGIVNASSCTINIVDSQFVSPTFSGGTNASTSYGTVNMTYGTFYSSLSLSGTRNIPTLNVTLASSAIRATSQISFAGSNSVSIGTLSIANGAWNQRVILNNATATTVAITTKTNFTHVDWRNVPLTAPYTAPLGARDLGGNTNVTFNTSTFYWRGGTGSSNNTTWSTSSGGAASGVIPGPQNPVVFNSSSDVGSAFTVTATADPITYVNSFTVTGLDQPMTLAGNWYMYGNITIPDTNFAYSSPTIRLMASSGTQTFSNLETATSMDLRFSPGSTASTATYVLSGSTFNCTNITFESGTLNLNGCVLTNTVSVFFNAASGVQNLIFNGGTLVVRDFNGGGVLTTTAGTGVGTIRLNGTSSFFTGGGLTYNCTVENAASTELTVQGSNTFTTLSNSTAAPRKFIFTAGTTQTVTNFNVSGTPANLVTIVSSTAGTRATLSKASGTVNASYLDIKDSSATGGATWNALNSINSGNNIGWNFTVAPTGNGLFFGSNF